jgi:hypothetical protein
MGKKVIAVCCSDIHLSLTPPVSRSAEPNWLDAQARAIKQLAVLCGENDCPLVIAGDVFDKSAPVPELINFTIEQFSVFPAIYAIPGQHDLPMHRYEDVHKSGYWTLVKAGTIKDISNKCQWSSHVRFFGFPWGPEIQPPPDLGKELFLGKELLNVAIAHAYIWRQGKGYPGAPETALVSAFRDNLVGYQVAIFGDNHNGFITTWVGGTVINCGCLIRRKSDEKKLKPQVGLLLEDGVVEVHHLDCSEDLWIDQPEVQEEPANLIGLDQFLKELASLDEDNFLDFRQNLRQFLDSTDNKVSDGAKLVITDVLEGSK